MYYVTYLKNGHEVKKNQFETQKALEDSELWCQSHDNAFAFVMQNNVWLGSTSSDIVPKWNCSIRLSNLLTKEKLCQIV